MRYSYSITTSFYTTQSRDVLLKPKLTQLIRNHSANQNFVVGAYTFVNAIPTLAIPAAPLIKKPTAYFGSATLFFPRSTHFPSYIRATSTCPLPSNGSAKSPWRNFSLRRTCSAYNAMQLHHHPRSRTNRLPLTTRTTRTVFIEILEPITRNN